MAKKDTTPVKHEDIIQSIRDGFKTSSKITSHMGNHKVTISRKLLKMYNDGLVSRELVGQTYVYSVEE